jgi:hypothetical protein
MTKVHPHMKPVPLRAPHRLSTVRPVGRILLPKVSRPSNDIPRASPVVERAVPSSPRFHSQAYPPCGRPPLSGFLAGSSFAALFHAATVRGILPSEVSPHRNRAPLSRSLLLPCGHPPTCWNATSRTLLPLVSPTPTLLTQSPGSPNDYGLPFHAPKRASRSPWVQAAELAPFRQLHPPRSLDPPASPFTPTRVAPSRRPILSWVSASLKISPPTPRILRPAQATRT